MMRRFFTWVVCVLMLAAFNGSAFAVEKKTKDKAAKQTVQKKTTAKTKGKTAGRTKASTSKKYDNFIDKNKNGIDDRRENLKKKTTAKTAKSKKKSEDKK